MSWIEKCHPKARARLTRTLNLRPRTDRISSLLTVLIHTSKNQSKEICPIIAHAKIHCAGSLDLGLQFSETGLLGAELLSKAIYHGIVVQVFTLCRFEVCGALRQSAAFTNPQFALIQTATTSLLRTYRNKNNQMASTSQTQVDSGATTGVATPATTTHNTHTGHHHHHHTGRRLRQLLRPDGKKVHIAGSPEEANVLRKTLTRDEKDDFDLVIHGSPEHVHTFTRHDLKR